MASSYSSILTQLVARLEFHTADVSGRRLRAIKFRAYPFKETDGERDLPAIRLFVPDLTERFMARQPCRATLNIKLAVTVKREGGVAALVTMVERTLDALDYNTAGVIDPLMAGTIRRPWDVTTENGFSTDLSMTMPLNLAFVPKRIPQRGKRNV